MKSIAKWLGMVALVSVFLLTWRGRTDQDVVVAQAPKTITVTRIYTGADGLSHAEDVEMKLNGTNAEMMNATGVQFSRRPPSTSDGAWHTGPKRQYVITLSGHSELELGDGTHVPTGPGHINLIEDTTGKGHITRNFGPDDRIVVTIQLADQTVANPGR